MDTTHPAPTQPQRPAANSLGARLSILIGVALGFLLLNMFIGRLIPVDTSRTAPARDAAVYVIHSIVYFCAEISYWALFLVLVYMVIRWALGAPIIDALRS